MWPVPELAYPSFPWRPLLAAGAAVLALAMAAIALNGHRPDVRGCAIAAARVMAVHDYSPGLLRMTGQRAIPACRSLTSGQFEQALSDTYLIEFGGRLPSTPAFGDLPPPAFRASSARAALRAGDAASRPAHAR